jgi:enoyl-CoA hydratase/carnithine racemase
MTNDIGHPAAWIGRRHFIIAMTGTATLAAGTTASDAAPPQTVAAPSAAVAGRVVVERRGAVLLIGMEWPPGRNRLDAAVIIGLGKAYYELEHDDAMRVGVLHAVGPDFCAGLDVQDFVAARAAGVLPPKEPVINALGLRPPFRTKPVVVAVQGRTQSVGHELFLASDVRVAASDAIFGQLEVTRGVFPGGGATVRMTREAGWGNAMRYLLTGDEWDADEARRLGLVQEVTSPGKQLDRAVEIANKIAVAAPLGVRATLASAHQSLAAEEATALAAVQDEFGRILQSEDAKEAQRAQRENRAPVYRGL